MAVGGAGFLNSERIYLRPNGSAVLTRSCFYRPMYKSLSEVLDLIKISFEGPTRKQLYYVRTFENSMVEESEWVPASYVGFEVEEYFVYEKTAEDRILLFRVQPFFLSPNKRIECKIYKAGQALSALISQYLGICAVVNQARLIFID